MKDIDLDPSAQQLHVRGRAHARFHVKRNTYRLRFNAVHKDQMATVQLALETARGECGTEYDTVALEMICLAYLASSPRAHRAPQPCDRSGDEIQELGGQHDVCQ